MNKVYLDGKYLDENLAKVSVFDRGFIFGDGIYEVIPVYNSKLFDVDMFLQRIKRSLNEVDITSPMSESSLLQMANELIELNKVKEGGIYIQITRGVAPRDFKFIENLKPTCMAFSFEKNILNSTYAKTGVKVVSVAERRWKRRDIKSISLLAQCMSKNDAAKQGAFEGWMLEDGLITEGTSSTAYIIKDNCIITPPLSNKVLPGIRRKVIFQIAKEENLSIEQRHFSPKEVLNADEAFLSSATTIVLPVINFDGHNINGAKIGKITTKIRQSYINKIKKEVE